ncbi:VOC family protein [Virgibacillus kekensis]|uniref:VOC family protein n=1 Tax=Virgibacillus kekensis TaxID=202261 RepID=A0ABV9DMT3_9BACI
MFINKVSLYSNRLRETKDFYTETLGLELLGSEESSFRIKVGESVLEFIESKQKIEPFYHFAFNIPDNVFNEAKEWTRSRVNLNEDEGDDEAHFEFLNSRAFYFNDPSGNIAEFIARRNNQSPAKEFSVDSIMNISEINLTVKDVKSAANQLVKFGIPVRENESVEENSLNFMGEAEDAAFLLLGPEGRRWIFSEKYSEVHPVSIQVDNQKLIKLDNGELKLEGTE